MFLDSRQFPFVAVLEAHWQAIRAEYLGLPTDLFDPGCSARCTEAAGRCLACMRQVIRFRLRALGARKP